MNRKAQAISGLLESLETLENDTLLAPGEVLDYFHSWVRSVGIILKQMGTKHQIQDWKDLSAGVEVSRSTEDSSLDFRKASFRSFLLALQSSLVSNDDLLPIYLFEGSPDNVKRLAEQANGCYTSGYIDAAAVMLRRVIELLIILSFENNSMRAKTFDAQNQRLRLATLLTAFEKESELSFHVSKNVKNHILRLRDLKDYGDIGAHGFIPVPPTFFSKNSEAIIISVEALLKIAGYR